MIGGVIAIFIFGAALFNARKQTIPNELKPTGTIILTIPPSQINSIVSPTFTQQKEVPLPLASDILRNFFSLIDQKRVSEAVMLMSSEITNEDSTKQAWGVQLNMMKSIRVIEITPLIPESTQASERTYKVIFEVTMDPSSVTAPIPYYGYENGENMRWVTLKKEGSMWRIMGIATGP